MITIKFNVAAINRCTETEGPFRRLAIWFQGCDGNCDGCCNPEYRPLAVRNLMTLEELVSIIAEAKRDYGIEGVTYSGGEPALQQGLPFLTEAIRSMGLGVISFTGHIYEDVAERLSGCDAVIDGEFDRSKPETKRKLIGSENQRVLYLTERYKDCHEWFNADDGADKGQRRDRAGCRRDDIHSSSRKRQ